MNFPKREPSAGPDGNRPAAKSFSIIGETCSFSGKIISKDCLIIDGSVTGTLYSSGEVKIGPKGRLNVEGEIDRLTIAGRLECRLLIKETLVVEASAQIVSDIIKLSPEAVAYEKADEETGDQKTFSPERENRPGFREDYVETVDLDIEI